MWQLPVQWLFGSWGIEDRKGTNKMLMTLVTWFYAGLTCFLLGIGIDAFTDKCLNYRLKKEDSIFWAGLVTATVYAQFFSIFYKVGMLANLVLVILCLAICIIRNKQIKNIVISWKNHTNKAGMIIVFVLIILWSYYTSRGYMHIDSDLYHAQSIRWIEEYGVVPGLGNLHERFAYNSSFFAVSALYSMKFILKDSMHTMSGFFALLLSVTSLDIVKSWKRKKFELSDYARIGAIYYLTTIVDEVVSPASDYAIMCVIFLIVIKWLDCLEEQKAGRIENVPYALLCVLCVYAITLKLTAGLILILLIKPAYMLIKKKAWKSIFIYFAMGVIVAIPWFARTVIISGWLIYPFPTLDLFQVDWKMNGELIALDAAQIKAWGRALYNVTLLDTSIREWFPNWFKITLSSTEKLLILGNIISCFSFVIMTIWNLLKRKLELLDDILVICSVVASYLFWQISAPLMRYGYAYVLLLDFLLAGWVINRISKTKMIYYLIVLFGIYKVFALGEEISKTYFFKECYIYQEDYGVFEMEAYEIEGYTFYVPVEGALQGYDYFPSSPVKADITLRGKGLEDGFRKR